VCPERSEGLVCFDEPEEIVEAPLCALLVQGITLEVEEDVSRVGNRDGCECCGRDDPPGRPR
jgi:hypothetical protein